MIINEACVLSAFLFFIWSEYFWWLYLTLRQLKVHQKYPSEIPDALKNIYNAETFEKARLYSMDRLGFQLVNQLYNVILTSVILYVNWYSLVWLKSEQVLRTLNWPNSEIVTNCVFVAFMLMHGFVVRMPLIIYSTFVLEEKHGFNKQTAVFFIKDRIKYYTLMILFSLPITSILIYIISRESELLIIWLWLFTTIIMLLTTMEYPNVIAPLFHKQTPLPDGALRNEIERLAKSVNFPLGQIFILHGSVRSSHSNAYFGGIFGVKTIILYDTLIEKYDEKKKQNVGCTVDELLGVLAHEMGHWKCNHVYLSLALIELNFLITLTAYVFLYKHHLLYTSLGFPLGQEPIIIGLIVVLKFVLAPYNFLMTFVMTLVSRKYEYEADEYAIMFNYGRQLEMALIKLNKDNLIFPIHDKLYSIWRHSHPTLLERIENIRKKTN